MLTTDALEQLPEFSMVFGEDGGPVYVVSQLSPEAIGLCAEPMPEAAVAAAMGNTDPKMLSRWCGSRPRVWLYAHESGGWRAAVVGVDGASSFIPERLVVDRWGDGLTCLFSICTTRFEAWRLAAIAAGAEVPESPLMIVLESGATAPEA